MTYSSAASQKTHNVVVYDGTLQLAPGSTAQASVEVPPNHTGASLAFFSPGTFTGLTWGLAGCHGSDDWIHNGENNNGNGRCTGPLEGGTQIFSVRGSRDVGSRKVHTVITVRVLDP